MIKLLVYNCSIIVRFVHTKEDDLILLRIEFSVVGPPRLLHGCHVDVQLFGVHLEKIQSSRNIQTSKR